MKSVLSLALVAASSTVLALPAATPDATFVGFPHSFSCSNGVPSLSSVAAQPAIVAAAAAGHVLQIGKVIRCSGVIGKEYRADYASCDLRVFLNYDIATNTYGFCGSQKGIPPATFEGFPTSLPCATGGADVSAAAAKAAAAGLYALGASPLDGGHSITCSDVEGPQWMASIDACDVKIVFTYFYDTDTYAYCEAIIGEPSYIGFPAELACGTTPVPASKLEADSLFTALSDPVQPSIAFSTCSGVSGHTYSNYYGDCNIGITVVQDAYTNTFGWCGTFVAGPGRK